MKTNKARCVLGIILMSAISTMAQNKDAKGSYASVNGLKMYYEIQGAGKPLVLLHGGMVTIEYSFDKTRPAFNKTWKTIAIEQQAHGHTNDIKDRPLTVEQMAEDTYALLKQLKVDSADFFGWSMGGGIALQIALKHPEMVRKVAVSGTAFYPAGQIPNQQEMMASLTPEMFPAEWVQEYARKNPDPKGFPTLLAKIKQFAADWKGMTTEEIKSIKAPILIILGDADIVRPEHAVEMFRLLPHAKLAVFPMTDHFVPVQRPEWFVAMVQEFLEAPMPEQKKTEAR
ncbi:MAG: alpha/beta fold hydrolase [bacterium]